MTAGDWRRGESSACNLPPAREIVVRRERVVDAGDGKYRHRKWMRHQWFGGERPIVSDYGSEKLHEFRRLEAPRQNPAELDDVGRCHFDLPTIVRGPQQPAGSGDEASQDVRGRSGKRHRGRGSNCASGAYAHKYCLATTSISVFLDCAGERRRNFGERRRHRFQETPLTSRQSYAGNVEPWKSSARKGKDAGGTGTSMGQAVDGRMDLGRLAHAGEPSNLVRAHEHSPVNSAYEERFQLARGFLLNCNTHVTCICESSSSMHR